MSLEQFESSQPDILKERHNEFPAGDFRSLSPLLSLVLLITGMALPSQAQRRAIVVSAEQPNVGEARAGPLSAQRKCIAATST